VESKNEIMLKASECLNCKNPICSRQGCPVKTPIPEFITKIKENDLKGAYQILQENNIMSNITSIICPSEQQCMSKCIRGIRGVSVAINELENFVNRWGKENNIEYKIKCKEKNNIKVAVIGSGPAGLACSTELAKMGFSVTLFEKEKKLGGLLRYGIPDFRLPKEMIDIVESRLKIAGVEIKTSLEFGKDITIESLKKQKYKAIFLGLGAEKSNVYDISKEKCKNIHKANEFLKTYNEGKTIKDLGKVVVIGGGNVAFDSARASLKMGATEAFILYRRDEASMPARKIELEEAICDGVEIIYQTKVIDSKIENGKLESVTCIETRMVDGKAVDIEGSNYEMSADTIIFAIGLIPDAELLEKINVKAENGLVYVDENQMTNVEGIFAGGDITNNKETVCKAIRAGKVAAKSIEKYINEKR